MIKIKLAKPHRFSSFFPNLLSNLFLPLFIILTLFSQLLLSEAWATHLKEHFYYPQNLIDYIEDNQSSNKNPNPQILKNLLYETLSKIHLQNKGERDVVVNRCPLDTLSNNDKTCLEHKKDITYSEARRHLFGNLHLEKNTNGHFVRDVYCHKDARENHGTGPGKIPNPNIMNCEHTWPQSKFSPRHSANLQKVDLHHLFPVDSTANSARSNFIFSDVDGPGLKNCTSSKRGNAIGATSITAFEPPDIHKGNVARALFYFSVRYTIDLTSHEVKVLTHWHELDPVDENERIRNQKIFEIQGNRNPFIDDPHLVNLVYDK